MWATQTNERELRRAKEDADYYRRQYEEQRERAERSAERERIAREDRRREIQAAYEKRLRTANNWPEALEKQATLFSREVNLEDDSDPNEDHLFSNGAQACKRALELWRAVERELQPQIDALQAQIDALYEGIRSTVADQLEAWKDNRGVREITNALRDPSLNLDDWLNW